MENKKLDVVHIGAGKETLIEVPRPPAHLSKEAKKYFSEMGKMLAVKERLKDIYLPLLEIYSVNMAQFAWACKEIEKKNKKDFGSGFIQVFKTGATNITTEIVIRNDAVHTLLKCFKQFGLDPRSEGELRGAVESGQYDLFEDFMKKKEGGI